MLNYSTSIPQKALNEINNELKYCLDEPKGYYLEEDFRELPLLIRSFFINSGYINKPKELNFSMTYKESYIKMNKNSKWKEINGKHYLFVNPIVRIVYLKAKLLKLFTFEGRDLYKKGKGNMLGKLSNTITIFNAVGKEMNQSALVTYLSELLLLPSVCISENVLWEEIDNLTVQVSLKDSGLIVKGKFHFNDYGQLTKFTTNDRCEDKTPYPWTLRFEKFKRINDINLPIKAVATWHYPDQDFDYFIGNLTEHTYNNDLLKRAVLV